jgi:hypothetical protein
MWVADSSMSGSFEIAILHTGSALQHVKHQRSDAPRLLLLLRMSRSSNTTPCMS